MDVRPLPYNVKRLEASVDINQLINELLAKFRPESIYIKTFDLRTDPASVSGPHLWSSFTFTEAVWLQTSVSCQKIKIIDIL